MNTEIEKSTENSDLSENSERLRITEINNLHSEIGGYLKMTLDKAIRVGELLQEVKEGLKHGAWLPWVEENLSFDLRSAQRYMKVAANKAVLESDSVSYLTEAYNLIEAPIFKPWLYNIFNEKHSWEYILKNLLYYFSKENDVIYAPQIEKLIKGNGSLPVLFSDICREFKTKENDTNIDFAILSRDVLDNYEAKVKEAIKAKIKTIAIITKLTDVWFDPGDIFANQGNYKIIMRCLVIKDRRSPYTEEQIKSAHKEKRCLAVSQDIVMWSLIEEAV